MKMFTRTVLSLAVLVASYACADELTLAQVQVQAVDTDNSFENVGAVSKINEERINQSVTGLDSVIRALPGTFTSMDTPQGTLSVNIRGTTGLGRVNTMVDGVPQTLFGITATSEEDGKFHESPPTTSAFGIAIDSNFLVGADIHRGGQSGGLGVNALMGSANFRTIGVDDILSDGRVLGGRLKYSYGSNKLGPNAMIALASQSPLGQGRIGGLLAVSGANKSTDYKRGDGKLASSNDYVIAKTQKPRSWLAKLEYNNNDQTLVLSGRDYKTNIGGRQLHSRSYGAMYQYRPESDWVDLAITANHSNNNQIFNENAKYGTLEQAKSFNTANYLDIHNTSYFYPALGEISSTYGVQYQNNDYRREAKATDGDALTNTAFSPAGTQQIVSYYLDNQLKKDNYTLDVGVSRVHTKFAGFKPACGETEGVPIPCFPRGEAVVSNDDVSTNGKIQLSFQANDWLTPFASYARTSRMPNIQEVFFGNEGGGSMNPFLKPEKADVAEVGLNISKSNLFQPSDNIAVKAVYFNSKIKDYIHVQPFFLSEQGQLTNDINNAGVGGFKALIAVNALQPVSSRGYELQANYVNDQYFANASYTHSKSDQPVNINSGFTDFGYSGGATDRLPETYWTLGLGANFLDKKLQLETQLKFYGKNVRLRPDGVDIDTSNYHLQHLPESPIITDLFARYRLNDKVALRLGVENAFDKLYIHPLNSQNATSSQVDFDEKTEENIYSYTNYARGRTFSVGATVDF